MKIINDFVIHVGGGTGCSEDHALKMVSKISRVGLLIPLKVFLLIIVGISFGQEGSSLLDDFGSGYPNVTQLCPTSVNCSLLPADCIQCEFNFSCRYGQLTKANCTPTDNVMCEVRSYYDVLFCSI